MPTSSSFSLTFSGNVPASQSDATVLKALVDAMTTAMPVGGTAQTTSQTTDAAAQTPASSTTQAAAPAASAAVTADPVAAKYFPADPGLAAFPSPENSRMVRNADGSISGRPYLLDKNGIKITLGPIVPAATGGIYVNDIGHSAWSSTIFFTQLLVRQGLVWAQADGGQWQLFNPGMGGFYNGALPDAYQNDATGQPTSTIAVSSAKAPTLPAPMSPAPGTSGKTLAVGPGKAFATITDAIKAALAGDTIEVDAGTYLEAPPVWTVPLYIKGVGGMATVDCTGMTASLARGKGAFVPCADTVLENVRATGVALDQQGAQLTSGVRPDTGCGYLTLKNVELTGNQSGLGSGGDLTIEITVDGGHFSKNGLPVGNDPVNNHGRGFAHNIYTGAGTSLILKNGFSSTEPDGGHAVKHRGFALSCSGGGSFDATEAAVFDVPNGTVASATIDGVTITKPAGSPNHAVIDYATDDTSNGNGGLLITNSTIQALCDNPFMLIGGGSKVTVDGMTKAKTTGTITAQGGTMVGY